MSDTDPAGFVVKMYWVTKSVHRVIYSDIETLFEKHLNRKWRILKWRTIESDAFL